MIPQEAKLSDKDHHPEAPSSSPNDLSRHQILQLTGAGLSLVAVCYGLARFGYGFFVPAFKEEFALDPSTIGLVASSSYLAFCLAIVCSTLLSPLLGSRAMVIIGGSLALIGILIIATSPTTWVFSVGVIVAGSSAGVISPPLAQAVAQKVPEKVRNRTQTVINAGTGIGVAIAGPIALIAQTQWRGAWIAFAALALVSTVWVAFATPPTRPKLQAQQRRRDFTGITSQISSALPPGSGRLVCGSVLFGIASAAVWVFGRDLLLSQGGLGHSDSTLAWILLGIFGILGALTGDLVSRVGLRASWQMLTLLLAVTILALALLPGHFIVVCTAISIFGAAYQGLTGVLLLWGTSAYPSQPTFGVGIAFLGCVLGQAIGAPVVGSIIQAGGFVTAFGFSALVALTMSQVKPHRLPASPTARESALASAVSTGRRANPDDLKE